MNFKLVFRFLSVTFMVLWFGGLLQAQTKTLIFPRVGQAAATLIPPSLPQTGTEGTRVNYNVVYNNLAVFQMGVSLVNAGGQTANMVLTVYNENGNKLNGPEITNPAIVSLPAGHQIARYVSELFGSSIQHKVGWIEAVCTGGDVKGFYFIFDNAFNFLSGTAAIPKEKATAKIILPLLDQRTTSDGKEYRTEVDIINPGENPVKIVLKQWFKEQGFSGDDYYYTGHSLLTWEKQILPHGKIQLDWIFEALRYKNQPGTNYFELLSEGGNIVASETVFRNSGPQPGIANQTHSVSAVTGMSQTEGIYSLTPSTGLPYARTHVTFGAGWYTKFVYIRPRFLFNFMIWDQSGKPVTIIPNRCGEKPGSCLLPVIHFNEKVPLNLEDLLTASSPSTLNGSISFWALKQSSASPPEDGTLDWVEYGPTAIVAGQEVHADDFRALVPPFPPTVSAIYPHVAEGGFAPNESFGTGIAIRDIRIGDWADKEANHVVLELYAADGKLLQTANVDLGPAWKIAMTLPQLFPNMVLPQFGGYIKASGTKPFVSFGMYWVEKNGKLVAVSMIPQL